MTFLLELREAAKKCSNFNYRVLLCSADDVSAAIDALEADPTKANMQDLNVAWTRAQKILEAIPAEGDPAPLAGAPEAAKLAMAA